MILQDSYGAEFKHANNTTPANTYIPGSLKRSDGTRKYQYSTIDSSSFSESWLSTLCSRYGGDASAVREAHVPSAMVDYDGRMYTINLYWFRPNYGPDFLITKYTANSTGGVSREQFYYYPWNCSKAGSTPNLSSNDVDSGYFTNFFHNCLQPCIAQPLTPGLHNHITVLCRIPPTRMFGAGASEGVAYVDIRKDPFGDMSNTSIANYKESTQDHPYWFKRGRYRRFSNYQYEMEKGNLRAWKYNTTVHIDFISNAYKDGQGDNVWHQYNSSYSGRSSLRSYHWVNSTKNCYLCPRYIYDDGYVYNLTIFGYEFNLDRWSPTSGSSVRKLYSKTPMLYLENTNWSQSPYEADFFIENGTNGKKLFCFLALGNVGDNTANTSSYNWSTTHCNWNINRAALLIGSLEFPSTGTKTTVSGEYDVYNESTVSYKTYTTANGDWAQNVIYVTPYNCKSYVSASNTSSEQVYRLYQNTHRMCKYVSSTGNKYVIYCYCYPGKEPQLYLGYARYWISNNKIMLGTKFEFRKTPDQWSESIANCFTSCSRIISMDCRAGHLWITWMNEDNTEYRYFHILAKDLIGE